MFEALNEVCNTLGYNDLYMTSNYIHPTTNESMCQILGALSFWNDTTANFEAKATANKAVLTAMSTNYFPYGGSVNLDQSLVITSSTMRLAF